MTMKKNAKLTSVMKQLVLIMVITATLGIKPNNMKTQQ